MKDIEEIRSTYANLQQIGKGAGGTVYKAYHKRLQKEVVLKKMNQDVKADVDSRKEVDILKNLHHTNLPEVLDFLEIGEDVFTVMTYIPGQSFQQLIDIPAIPGRKDLIDWSLQLCNALSYLHHRKPPIIHSDIKPANVMLSPGGQVYLIDFNISLFLNDETALGYTKGYASPEQYQSHHVDVRSDIYSLGATLYHLVTGRQVTGYERPIDMEVVRMRVGDAFAAILDKALQPRPEDRFATADQMEKALKGLPKKDQRYQHLVLRQRTTNLFLAAGLTACIVLTGLGVGVMKQEKQDRYDKLVKKQADYVDNGEYAEAEELFFESVEMLPKKLDSYYQQARALYDQGEYEECVEIIDSALEKAADDKNFAGLADVHCLKAEAFLEQEEYADSVREYKTAMKYGVTDAKYYRDYAIALAYDGQNEKAQDVLDEAESYGLGNDSISYAKGEIAYVAADYNKAEESFKQCITETENDTLKMRAYVLLSRSWEEQSEPEENRKILLKATDDVSEKNQMILLERLIDVDLKLANDTGKKSYLEEAVKASEKVIDNGWDTYTTYDNLVILCQKLGKLKDAENYLDMLAEKYGEDYNVYKRYAFLEVEKQERKSNQQRDYEAFESYYQKAADLYYKQLKDNNTDPEMQLLENAYNQVLEGGWLNGWN